MQKVIDQPKFQEELKKISKAHKRKLEDVQKEAEACIAELYAKQDPIANMATLKGFEYMMSKAYEDKIDVDPQEIKKLMKLMRKNSVAFILTHKTYLDTVVLINTLSNYGIPIPYFFGGINYKKLKYIYSSKAFLLIDTSGVVLRGALRKWSSEGFSVHAKAHPIPGIFKS